MVKHSRPLKKGGFLLRLDVSRRNNGEKALFRSDEEGDRKAGAWRQVKKSKGNAAVTAASKPPPKRQWRKRKSETSVKLLRSVKQRKT